jgi:tetratricopeptide (TPR) repeat protein
VWTGLAWALCRTPRHRDAVGAAERALELDPKIDAARLAEGLARLRMGEFDAAEAAVVAAVRGGARAEDAERRAAFGEAADAGLELLMQLSEAMPGDPWPYYFSALLLAGQGRGEAARAGLAEFEDRVTDEVTIERARESLRALLVTDRRDESESRIEN